MLSANIIHPARLKAGLFELLGSDSDHNGENGEMYLLPEAKEAGYFTNLEYWIDTELNNERNRTARYFDQIENVIDAVTNKYYGESYYCNFEHSIEKYNDVYFCAISYQESY